MTNPPGICTHILISKKKYLMVKVDAVEATAVVPITFFHSKMPQIGRQTCGTTAYRCKKSAAKKKYFFCLNASTGNRTCDRELNPQPLTTTAYRHVILPLNHSIPMPASQPKKKKYFLFDLSWAGIEPARELNPRPLAPKDASPSVMLSGAVV